jgi:hypothetical protein
MEMAGVEIEADFGKVQVVRGVGGPIHHFDVVVGEITAMPAGEGKIVAGADEGRGLAASGLQGQEIEALIPEGFDQTIGEDE